MHGPESTQRGYQAYPDSQLATKATTVIGVIVSVVALYVTECREDVTTRSFYLARELIWLESLIDRICRF